MPDRARRMIGGAHASFVLVRHFYRVARGGQLRFRLETFGLYYPAPPYAAAWWRVSPRALLLLLLQAPAYGRWVIEMEEIKRGGYAGQWHQQFTRISHD